MSRTKIMVVAMAVAVMVFAGAQSADACKLFRHWGGYGHGCGHASHGCGQASHGCGHGSHGCGQASHGCGHGSHGCGHASHGCGHGHVCCGCVQACCYGSGAAVIQEHTAGRGDALPTPPAPEQAAPPADAAQEAPAAAAQEAPTPAKATTFRRVSFRR